jgi:hypothetical protein
MKKSSILFTILTILLIVSVISPGCLQEKEPGQLPTMTPPAEISDNSSMNAISTEPTITATTTYPAEQSGVRIFKDADSICVGQDLNFGLINEGNSTIEFSMGNPYKIQFFMNESWVDLYWGGGTQAFWHLGPSGKYERDLFFVNLMKRGAPVEEYFTITPGLYRIIIYGMDSGKPFAVATEFTVKDC